MKEKNTLISLLGPTIGCQQQHQHHKQQTSHCFDVEKSFVLHTRTRYVQLVEQLYTRTQKIWSVKKVKQNEERRKKWKWHSHRKLH